MDQFNFNDFPNTNFNEVNLSWMLEVMSQFKEDLESGQFVGPQGPQGPKGDPGPAGDGITEEVKQALLQLARKVAYIDDQGQTYYQDLYDALYGVTPTELVSISAVYTQAGPVYDTDSLDSLKADLIVTATYSDSSTAVIPAADYTLSGSLTVGTSTITVSYQGKTATFQVTVTASAVTLVSIAASFNQGSAVIYESDSLDSLKQYLTVTATYSDSTTATIPSTDYTLSGTLTEGTSTITVSYRGETDTFQVTVTADPVPVTLVSISAVYTQSGAVYDVDSLDSLKADLVVTATYSDSTTAVIPSTDYTLSGALTAGTSTITASYQGKTATFSVTVTGVVYLYNDGDECSSITGGWDMASGFVSSGNRFTATNDGESLTMETISVASNACATSISTHNAIDLSGYNTLVIEGAFYRPSGSGNYWVYWPATLTTSSNQNTAYGSDYAHRRHALHDEMGFDGTRATSEIDITDYSSAYISLNLNLWGNAPVGTYSKAYRIYLK